MRLVVDQDSPLIARFDVDGYPTLKILSADGSVLGEPEERTVSDMVQAAEKGKKADQDFQNELAKGDVTQPTVRSDLVCRYVERGDLDSARKLYQGFDPSAPAKPRFDAMKAIGTALAHSGKLDEASHFLDDAQKTFTQDDQLKDIRDLRAEVLMAAIGNAVDHKDRTRALTLLDVLCEKYPDYHGVGERKEEIKQKIEDQLR